jgi:putative YphP/YqiW family bacilliredoxin
MALENSANKPNHSITVFAGADIDATDVAREYFAPYAPSSPSIGLIQDGKLVKMFERKDLEGRHPLMIAQQLVAAFDEVSAKTEAAGN